MNIGYHTPELTAQILKQLNAETNYQFEDSSWHNDACDSVYNELTNIQVYIPNGKITKIEDMVFSLFQIGELDSEVREEYKTIEEVINHLNEL